MTVIEFLRDIGKHFSMTSLVQRDYIAKRLGENGAGISYAEFSYTILQGLDFLHLYDTYGCTLQLGGSDQWGNCISGVELIRRARSAEAQVITLPLIINKATGKKFGKSEEGAVWLDPEKTSPYKFYQFWLNTDDTAAEDYLKIFTELGKPAIDQIIRSFEADRAGRSSQKALAWETTKLIHGEEKAASVRNATEALFGGNTFDQLSNSEVDILKEELTVVHADNNYTLPAIIEQAGLASSKSEALRLVDSGAILVNGKKASKHEMGLLRKGDNLIRRGKNNFAIVTT